ncbi:ribose ABC transporter permease RbsC [Klebsiella variicola]|uniref:Ribose ABC transporter permease RbsC n=1 Tax=Klebsiella variicola TaxID=244366 RepID=A0A7H4MBK0_KLEVA|nr:ribose ABC transporter permease RbsC [Klebsiella variicola]
MSIPKETSAPVAKSASAKKMLMGDLMQTVGILPILILIVAVFGFIAPQLFHGKQSAEYHPPGLDQHCAGGGNDLHHSYRRH